MLKLFNKLHFIMKKVLFSAVLCLLCAAFSSCSNDESLDSSVNLSSEQVLAPVTVAVSGFAVEQGDFSGTRATPVGDYSEVKVLTLAFYRTSDGGEAYKYTQYRNSLPDGETFGEFLTTLPVGNYTMVVLANGGSNAITLTSATAATYGENPVKDTFVTTQAVNITNGNAVNLNATLDRICTAIGVQSTDNRTAEVSKIRITTSTGGKSFNPTTGLATVNTGLVSGITFSSAAGSTTYSGVYFFIAADEQTTNVTVETLNANDDVLYSKTINNVPLKRNRITKLTGAIYSGTSASAGSFQVNTGWLSDEGPINF